MLEVTNGAAFALNFPIVNWVKTDGTQVANAVNTPIPSAAGILQASGIDFIGLWSHDGGTTVYGKVLR